MEFRYPRQMFAIRAMALLAILACILFIMVIADTNTGWLLGFSAIYMMAALITTITPMFTRHELDSDGIRLRHGLVFNTSFSFGHIETVESFARGAGLLGPAPRRGRIVLASGNKRLVRIKLNHSRRFGMLLLRQADEIIIDLEKPDEFVKLANQYMMS